MKTVSLGYHSQNFGVITTRPNERDHISLRPSCRVRHRVSAVDRSPNREISPRPNNRNGEPTWEAVGFGLALLFVCALAGSFAWGITIFCRLIDQAIPGLMQNLAPIRLG